jgi:hypothetical protein
MAEKKLRGGGVWRRPRGGNGGGPGDVGREGGGCGCGRLPVAQNRGSHIGRGPVWGAGMWAGPGREVSGPSPK